MVRISRGQGSSSPFHRESETGNQVFFMQQVEAFNLATQARDNRLRQGHNAVSFPFAIAHGN